MLFEFRLLLVCKACTTAARLIYILLVLNLRSRLPDLKKQHLTVSSDTTPVLTSICVTQYQKDQYKLRRLITLHSSH